MLSFNPHSYFLDYSTAQQHLQTIPATYDLAKTHVFHHTELPNGVQLLEIPQFVADHQTAFHIPQSEANESSSQCAQTLFYNSTQINDGEL